MRNFTLWVPLLSVLLATTSLASVAGCPDCASSLSLSHAQVDCVSKRLDKLILRSGDTVFFDASACGRGSGTMAAANPLIMKPTSPSPKPDALWVLLTKKQLACVRAKVAALPRDRPEPVVLELDDASCVTLPP